MHLGFYVIYSSFPVVLGILILVQLSLASSLLITFRLTLAFWSFSLALNVVATLLIAGRLYYYRRRAKRTLGTSHASQYTSVIAMVIESELLYTSVLVVQLAVFALGHPVSNAIIQFEAQVQVRNHIRDSHRDFRLTKCGQAIAALMIVFRVAKGQGWTKDTHAVVSAWNQTTGAGAVIQLTNASSYRTAVQVTQEVYSTKDSRRGSQADASGERLSLPSSSSLPFAPISQ